MKIVRWVGFGTTIGLIVSLNSCKILEPTKQPRAIEVPMTFASGMDSAGIGAMNWRAFFNDDQLKALIDTALQSNLDLKSAVQRIEMAQSVVTMRQGLLLPSANAELSAGGRKFGDYTMDGVGNYDTNFSDNIDSDRKLPAPFMPDYFVGVRSSWEIDVWGKLKTQKKAAFDRFLATQKARHAVVTGIIAQVASLYYELITLDVELSIIHNNIALQEKAVYTITIQKEAGRANELGVKQFTAQLLNTRSLEFDIRQKIVERENELNTLLGRFPQPIARNKGLTQQIPQQISAGVPSQMLRRRPDVQQALLDLNAHIADQHAAKLAFLPSVNITAFLGFNAFKSALLLNPGSLAYGALGGIAGPLLNRKGLKAEKRRSEAASREALYFYNKTILTGFQEISTSLRKLENTQRIVNLKNEEVAVLQQAVAASQDLFVGGYATYLEIIMAQKGVLDAELSLVNVQKEQSLALIQLYRALGGGWE
jgi:outer membrane protein, multidrug efflux system